jgi:hypothetical protein
MHMQGAGEDHLLVEAESYQTAGIAAVHLLAPVQQVHQAQG